MKTRPLVEKAWSGTARAEFDAACKADPLIAEAVQHAMAATDEVERGAHLAFAAFRLAARAPSLPESDWRSVLIAGLAGHSTRIGQVPGVAGRVVWAVRDDADAEALRAAVGQGQVWIRSDLVKSDDWPTVRAHAMDALERTIGTVRPVGRRKGSTNRARDALLVSIRAQPDMTAEEIDRRATELGHTEPALDEYEMGQRAKRLRSAAKRIKP